MSPKTILIIDDDETILSLVAANLKKSGYASLSASNGEEGIKSARKHKPDAIILDWIMPGMDGDEVLNALKDNEGTAHIPVIMLTARNEVNNVSDSLQHGAKDYIVKPYDHNHLIKRLEKLL